MLAPPTAARGCCRHCRPHCTTSSQQGGPFLGAGWGGGHLGRGAPAGGRWGGGGDYCAGAGSGSGSDSSSGSGSISSSSSGPAPALAGPPTRERATAAASAAVANSRGSDSRVAAGAPNARCRAVLYSHSRADQYTAKGARRGPGWATSRSWRDDIQREDSLENTSNKQFTVQRY
eukprot:COSAG04_NODE_1185_length_7876_cov_15.856629_4_plen_175_part_00